MRMVGNTGSSVDYRVITILHAPGMEKGRVTPKKSDQQREKEQICTITPHREGEERAEKRERIFSP